MYKILFVGELTSKPCAKCTWFMGCLQHKWGPNGESSWREL